MFRNAKYKKFARVAVIIVSIGVVLTYVPLLFVPKAQAPAPAPAQIPDQTSADTSTIPLPEPTSTPSSTLP